MDLERTGSVGERLTDCAKGWAVRNSDEEMGQYRRRPVGGLRLRGATDDGPPPLLPPTRRGLTADNLATVTERAKACARKWENIVWRTRHKKKKPSSTETFAHAHTKPNN